jgi:hypothetical protein
VSKAYRHRCHILIQLSIGTKLNQTSAKTVPFKHIWLTIEQSSSADEIYQLLDAQMFVAEKKNECVDFFSTVSPQDRIIFIVNEQLARSVVSWIHDQCAVKVVFIIRSLTYDPQFGEWTKPYIKVRTFKS